MYEDAELETLLDQDFFQMQEELASTLGVIHQAISHHLKSLEMIQKKQGNWIPYELTPRNVERRFSTKIKCCLPSINERVFCIV